MSAINGKWAFKSSEILSLCKEDSDWKSGYLHKIYLSFYSTPLET